MSEPDPGRTPLQRWTFLVLFVLTAYLFWRVAEPLWAPICLGALFAIGAHPLHLKLARKIPWKSRDALSAALLTSGVMAVLLGIFAFFGAVLLKQALAVAGTVAEKAKQGQLMQSLPPQVSHYLSAVGQDPQQLQQRISGLVNEAAGAVANIVPRVVGASFAMILVIIFTAITCFYLLKHGVEFTRWLVRVIPLPDGEVWELVKNFRDTARVMLLGTGVTALYQGVVSFLAYWVCGVPAPIVWGTLTGFASIVPAIGTTLIWGPIVVWLVLEHRLGAAVGLALWGFGAIIGVADYLLRPKLLGSKVKMNDLLIFIALFGGIEAFGVLGTILGPIICAILMSLIHIYLRDYKPAESPGSGEGGREEPAPVQHRSQSRSRSKNP